MPRIPTSTLACRARGADGYAVGAVRVALAIVAVCVALACTPVSPDTGARDAHRARQKAVVEAWLACGRIAGRAQGMCLLRAIGDK